MQTSQVQLKISLSEKLDQLLKSKAERLGIPETQLVKYLIIKDLAEEKEVCPVYPVSKRTAQKAKKALKDIKYSVAPKNIKDFFEKL